MDKRQQFTDLRSPETLEKNRFKKKTKKYTYIYRAENSERKD